MIPALAWLPKPDTTGVSTSGQTLVGKPPSDMYMFMFAYFCAGVGIVVSSIFIVAVIDQQSSLAGQGACAFMILGVGLHLHVLSGT